MLVAVRPLAAFRLIITTGETGNIKLWTAVNEPLRVIEIVRRRQQVRVLPDLITRAGSPRLGERAPHRRCLAEPSWPQFQANQGGERPLGRAAGSPATPDSF